MPESQETDESRRQEKRSFAKGSLARRVMAALLAFIAIMVVLVLIVFGLRTPAKGPGNVPANGEALPLRNNGSPPTSK